MAGDLGVGRGFLEGGDEELGGFHGAGKFRLERYGTRVKPLDGEDGLCIMGSVNEF
jgi:hypothetical protein